MDSVDMEGLTDQVQIASRHCDFWGLSFSCGMKLFQFLSKELFINA